MTPDKIFSELSGHPLSYFPQGGNVKPPLPPGKSRPDSYRELSGGKGVKR
jgi:hypothetical protein